MTNRRWQKGSLSVHRGVWRLRFRVDVIDSSTGLVRRAERAERLGPATRSRKWAEAAAKRLIRSIDLTDLALGKASSASAAIDRYERDHLILVKFSSQASYRSLISRHIRPALQGLTLGRLDTTAIQRRLVTPMVKAKLRRSTIEGVVVLLARILKIAQREGFALGRFDPKQLVFPVRDLSAERVYSQSEAQAILAAELPPQQKAFFSVSLLTGLRVSEVLGLRWSDCDFEARVIHVRRSAVAGRLGTTKTRVSAATRPMSDQLAMRLEEWRQASPATPSGLLFHTKSDRPVWRSHVHRSWLTPLCKRLGIEHRGIHGLRHSFGHAAGALGSATAVRDLLRHQSLTTSDMYLRQVSSDLVHINQKISDRLVGPTDSENVTTESVDKLRNPVPSEPVIPAIRDELSLSSYNLNDNR